MNQSGAGLWWSLWAPSSSGYSVIWCTETKWGCQGASPEGTLGEGFSPSLGFVWRLWDCPGHCECSACALCAPWTAAVLGTQDVPGRCSYISITITQLCHWKGLAGPGCAAVPGCIFSKSMGCLCQDAKLFTALMHWAVPSCPWKHSAVKYTPLQKRSQ